MAWLGPILLTSSPLIAGCIFAAVVSNDKRDDTQSFHSAVFVLDSNTTQPHPRAMNVTAIADLTDDRAVFSYPGGEVDGRLTGFPVGIIVFPS